MLEEDDGEEGEEEKKKIKDKVKVLSEIDKLIHEPARSLIVSYLYVLESADFLFLKAETCLTRGNLSSHIAKLEEARYVTIEKKFVRKKSHTIASPTLIGRKAFENYQQNMNQALA